jgi:replicative DNA helicase
MFIYRKAQDRNYNFDELPEDEKYKAEIHVAKHRNGPTGKVNMFFEEETVSFKSVEKSNVQEPPPEL